MADLLPLEKGNAYDVEIVITTKGKERTMKERDKSLKPSIPGRF